MLNRPSRTQNEEIVPVGRGEREQRWTLEEESQHCIFPEVIPPRWTHVKRSEQQGLQHSRESGDSSEGLLAEHTKALHKKKDVQLDATTPGFSAAFSHLLSSSSSSPKHRRRASLRGEQRVSRLRQAWEGKTVNFKLVKNVTAGCSEHCIAWKTKPLGTWSKCESHGNYKGL